MSQPILDFDDVARMDGYRAPISLRIRLWAMSLIGLANEWSSTYTFEDGTKFQAEGWYDNREPSNDYVISVRKIK